MVKEKSESGWAEMFEAMSEKSVKGNLYGQLLALLEMEKYILTEKAKVHEQLNKIDKPVPMTEEEEYRNEGITKEEARKNG
tara:strand:+ start:240 stop:482 length:243 start_codon:yes stop_codon:yes gene_type:complete